MTAYYNECDPFAVEWLKCLIANDLIAHGHVDNRSIKDVRASDLAGYTQHHFFAGIGGWSISLRKAGWPDHYPVWTGSCPCQPFSGAGKRKGYDDDRHLWPTFYELVRAFKPNVIFGEQVAGPDGMLWAEQVSYDLKKGDYECGFFVFPAYAFGAPQKRDRTYFVADATLANAARGAADVWGNRRVQPMEAHSWPSPAWEPRDADFGMLHDGLPSGLVKSCLRGLGNAIIPQAASEVVSAFLAALSHGEGRK